MTNSTTYGGATVYTHPSVAAMSRAAADQAATAMRAAVGERGSANVMFATGNSQLEFLEALVTDTEDVPWKDTVIFHMDEYVGVGPDDPPGFGRYIRERIVERTSPPRCLLRRGAR